MANKYLEKIAGPLGTNIVRPLESLVNRTKQVSTGLMNRERNIGIGFSTKPTVNSGAKLQALRNQSATKQWSN